MGKTQYEIVWKKGGWFENGHFALIPKKSLSDKAGEALLMYIIFLVLLLFVLSIIAITSPVWIIIVGYQMVREKRYYAGLASLIAIGYFYLDINEKWLTSFLFFGYTNSSDEFIGGLFSLQILDYLKTFNLISAGLGLGYIIDSVYVSKYLRRSNDDKIRTPQVFIYIFCAILGFLLSHLTKNTNNHSNMELVLKETKNMNDYEGGTPVVVDTTSSSQIENSKVIIDSSEYQDIQIQEDLEENIPQSVINYDNFKNAEEKTEYYSNGEIRRKVHYINGLLNGKCINFKTQGKNSVPYEEGFYVDGLKEGVWLQYSPIWANDGNSTTGEYYIEFKDTYYNNDLNGVRYQYHQNGNLARKSYFINNRETGKTFYYDEKGELETIHDNETEKWKNIHN